MFYSDIYLDISYLIEVLLLYRTLQWLEFTLSNEMEGKREILLVLGLDHSFQEF